MYDWNKDGKIDMVDHWITHQIINYEKEKRENECRNQGPILRVEIRGNGWTPFLRDPYAWSTTMLS